MLSGTSLAQVSLSPASKPECSGGVITEFFYLAAGTTHTIYGKGNTNAGASSCKKIEQIINVQMTPCAAPGSNNHAAVSTDETTDDTVTITTSNSVAKFVIVHGYGAEA